MNVFMSDKFFIQFQIQRLLPLQQILIKSKHVEKSFLIDLFYDELFCEEFSSGVVFVLGGTFFLEIILWDISS